MSTTKLTDFFSKRIADKQNDQEKENEATKEQDEDADVGEHEAIVVTEKFHPPKNFKFKGETSGKQNRYCQHSYFDKFPWLHYDKKSQSVVCFPCAIANNKGYLAGQSNKNTVFINKGFKSWKKAPPRFTEHQQSKTHTITKTYEIVR